MQNLVYELRIKKGLTLQQLAEKAQVAKSTINYFENGITNPKIETITRIANALDVSMDRLLAQKKKTVNTYQCPNMTKEEYLAEMQKALSTVETYKVRYFYIFTMVKLGILPRVEGGAAHE